MRAAHGGSKLARRSSAGGARFAIEERDADAARAQQARWELEARRARDRRRQLRSASSAAGPPRRSFVVAPSSRSSAATSASSPSCSSRMWGSLMEWLNRPLQGLDSMQRKSASAEIAPGCSGCDAARAPPARPFV
jgi:hypothetical protein